MKKRIQWIDVAKGLLIILVIVGHAHVNSIVDLIIYSFHMAAFFVITGYTFHANSNWKSFLLKQIKSLLIPYYAFAALLLIFDAIKALVLHTAEFNLLSGLLSVFFPISGLPTTTVYGLWFLPCLFLAKIIMFFGLKKRFVFIIVLPICVIIHFISGLVSVISLLPFTVLFIATGFIFRKIEHTLNRFISLLVSAVVFIFSIVVNFYFYPGTKDLSSLNLGFIPLYIISSLSGTYLIISLAKVLEKMKLIANIGKNSLYYYGLHYEVLSGFSFVLPVLFGEGIIAGLLSAFGTIIVLWILNLLRVFICRKIWGKKNV